MDKIERNIFAFIFAVPIALCFIICSCTLSFQNIQISGYAEDLVDEKISPDNNIEPQVNVP